MTTRAIICFVLAHCAATLPILDGAPQTPTRPQLATASSAVKSFAGIPYVSLNEVSRELAFQLTVNPRTRAVTLNHAAYSAEFTPGSRESKINGLRVFLGDPAIGSANQIYISRIDYDTCVRPLLRPGFPFLVPPRPRIIAIDAGHGGADPGTENPKIKIQEKSATLDVALRLKPILERDGYQVVLTRTDDHLLAPSAGPEELARRSAIAMRARADLLVSVHFNAVDPNDQVTQGVEVYTFPPATQHATEWWNGPAKAENDVLPLPETNNHWDAWNVVLAEALHRDLIAGLKAPDRGKKLKHLGVLRGLDCPAVLVEPAVLTNNAEARRVSTPAYRQAVAEAIASGIRHYTAQLESLRSQRPGP